MPILSFPLALIALTALPALGAIYWLRSRSRRRVVSSLMFWMDHRKAHQGGRIFQRMQIPLLLLLELLAIGLLALAAAEPQILRSGISRPLIVVLDDSFSMQAGIGQSARDRAAEAIAETISDDAYSARFIVAGDQPRLLQGSADSQKQAEVILDKWKCDSMNADLPRAIALAGEIGGRQSRILVISDHKPTAEIEPGRIEYWSFGQAIGNVAIVSASRSVRDGGQKVLLEIANLSTSPAQSSLILTGGDYSTPKRTLLSLEARQTKRIFLSLSPDAPKLEATLADDALSFDNRAILLPETDKPVRVGLKLSNEKLRDTISKALKASKAATIVSSRAELVITDSPESGSAGAWRLVLVTGSEASAYVGPFVIDRSHPLSEGLQMEGVIWAAPNDRSAEGAPVITAGNVVLLADNLRPDGTHNLQMCLSPELSTLTDSPNWPILIWNLLKWRSALSPGADRHNLRLGEQAGFVIPKGIETAVLLRPDGSDQDLPVLDRRVAVAVTAPGVYTLNAGDYSWSLAANPASREESDLAAAQSGRWGSWSDSEHFLYERADISWLLALGAIAVLTFHLMLVSRSWSGGAA